jgi:cytoskeleton protein RodZ
LPVVSTPESTREPVAQVEPLVPEEPPAAPVSAAEGVVVFEFSGPCWVEVRDNTGRARIIGMMRDGIRRRLDAQLAPFRVVIGDIQVARVSVNGEAYDLGRHTRGKVARFTLDPSRL